MVRLKHNRNNFTGMQAGGLNSTMVRLKHNRNSFTGMQAGGLNSTMVRLKPSISRKLKFE